MKTIKEVEGEDIIDAQMQERRHFYRQWKEKHGKLPENILEKFYDMKNGKKNPEAALELAR